MGQAVSTVLAGSQSKQPKKEPPKLVLVPPLFQRDLKARGRFAASSYDYLPPRKPLKWLLTDYLHGPGASGCLALCPPADPRLTIKARVGTNSGSMTLRWQPLGPDVTHTFLELKANPLQPGDARIRASALHASGVGLFTVLPLAKRISGQAAQVGVRYSSSNATAGFIVSPRSSELQQLWLAGCHEGLTLGLQLRPALQLSPSVLAAAGSGSGKTDSNSGSGVGVAGREVLEWLRQHADFSLSYTPPAASSAATPVSGEGPERGGPFTVGVEVLQGSTLAFSFLQRMAPTRRVVNPLEDGGVVGIVNYLDIGLLLVTNIAPQPELSSSTSTSVPAVVGGSTTMAAAATIPATSVTAATAEAKQAAAASSSSSSGSVYDTLRPGLAVGTSWQVNKNWLLKARVGTESSAAALGLRVWGSSISVAATASAHFDYKSRLPKYGLTLQVENHGPLMYRRDAELHGGTALGTGPSGRAVLQRHEASGQEVANQEGAGRLVLRSPAGDLLTSGGVLGPVVSDASRLM